MSSYYGKRYTSQVLVKIARRLEQAGLRLSWGQLLDLARDVEGIVRQTEQARYEDWRD